MSMLTTFDYAVSSIKFVKDGENSHILIAVDIIKQQQWQSKIELINLSESLE
jgi:hypothetical protein